MDLVLKPVLDLGHAPRTPVCSETDSTQSDCVTRVPKAAPELPSELDLAGDFEGGTDLTLLYVLFVRLGLKEGPEASEARESTLLDASQTQWT